jgi:dolichyl-phosphate beta-glucosyltransferase
LVFAYLGLVALSPSIITYSPEDSWYCTPEDPIVKQQLPSLEDEPSLDLTVVVPAYNEATRLIPMLKAALEHLLSPSTPARSFEILIVNDGSTDGTEAVAISALHEILPSSERGTRKFDYRVVRLSRNRGKGCAVKFGALHSRGRRILMVDADGASQFCDLELLWKGMDVIELNGRALAVGSRAHMVDTDAVVKVSFNPFSRLSSC